MAPWLVVLGSLLVTWPSAARAATTPRIAIVQCAETYAESSHMSQMSSQALVGMAVLLGVHYETLLLEEALAEPPDRFTGLWFSACLWVGENNHADLVAHLAGHLQAGGSVFLDGPLGVFYRDAGGVERFRGMGAVAGVLGIDWGGWRSTAGWDVRTTGSLHPAANRAGYGFEAALTVDMKSGTDTMVPADATAEVLLELVSPFDGTRYPFLVATETISGAKVAAVGGYGNFGGVASPFRNSPSPAFSDNKVLPYLLETLVWATAPDPAPYAGLQVSHAPVTMLGRLDGDWSGVWDATENTLHYLNDLAMETGIATAYGIVSEFAESAGTWPVFAALGPTLQALGGSIGSHSRTHPDFMSDELDAAGWESEVAGSFDEIRQTLTSGGFTPDAYAFINPGNTIRAEDYGEFFDDVEVYLSHGYEPFTPYSTGVQGFGLPSGVPARAVINDVVAPDYQWLYSSSWVYTVDEAAAFQAQILDYYQQTVGRGVVYNQMWHDYSLGGNAAPEHYPDTPSVLPLFETARRHFWDSETYAPTVAEAVGKLYVAQGTVITSSYSSGQLRVDVDYSAVPAKYREHIAGMGLKIHQQGDPIQRVMIDGSEHRAFSDGVIMMPAPSGASQQVTIDFGAAPATYRLRYASKPVSSVVPSGGGGVVATLAQPGSAMKYCFVAPPASVVLGADLFERTAGGEACGHLLYGNSRSTLELQPLDTGELGLFVQRATRPLAGAHAIQDGAHIDYHAGGEAVIEFVSSQQPSEVVVDGVLTAATATAGGFSVRLPARLDPGAMQVRFDAQSCEIEVSCDDGFDNDCDGAIDCDDSDCAGGASCAEEPRLVVLTDVSDATVREPQPQTNFGALGSLEIDTAAVRQHALIKPDHLADIAPGSEVVSARVVLRVFNPGDVMEVREVLGSWNEATVTWNSAPAVAASIHTTARGDLVGEVAIDITAVAQRWVDGAPIEGIALLPTGSDGVDLHSSEATSASLRPSFELEIAGGGGPCPDGDGDGHAAAFCGGDDCDDADPGRYPGAGESCDDGIDNDCDGSIDCADGDCAGASVCDATPRQVMVTDVSDATLRESTPDSNLGAADSLEIDTSAVFQYAVLRPDHLADIAPGSRVVSARLVVHVFNPGDTMEVREVLSPWSEAAVTWNGAPSLAPGAFTTVGWDLTGTISIDITALAQRWVDGEVIHGLALFPTGTDGVDIDSSEAASVSLRPAFVFEIAGDGGGECVDEDGDGHPAGFCGGDDCDDADAATHPDAGEQCGDGLDNDCDELLDCADGDCSGDAECTGGQPVTIVIENLDDAYVSDASPGGTFGASESLEIDTWAARKRAFIKPNGLGGLAPGAQVVSANLVLEIHDAGDVVVVAEAVSTWSESSITWNDAPSSAGAFSSLPAGISGGVAIDVTELVQRWVDGAPAHGVVLEPTSSNGVKLRSTEYTDAARRPRLIIEAIP